jgi:hypothetical protein
MNAQVTQLYEVRTEIHVCRCCGHVTTVIEQPSLVPGRNLVQIECHTPGCGSWYKTVYARDIEQVAEYYMVIGVDIDQLPALVEGIEVMSSVYA